MVKIIALKNRGVNPLRKNAFPTFFKPAILLFTTFLLGCFMAKGLERLLEKNNVPQIAGKPAVAEDSRDVFVLKSSVREGGEIFPADVIVVRRHQDQVPPGAVKSWRQIEGRNVKVELAQGTLLREEHFVAKSVVNNTLGFIPPGYHSVPIEIREPAFDGTKQLVTVLPGDQVDMILKHVRDTETDDTSKEFVLLEKIPVLDAVWNAGDDARILEKIGVVSLLLSDSQQKRLQEEIQEGTKIRLRVCPPDERQTVGQSQSPNLKNPAEPSLFYQSGGRHELISQSLDGSAPLDEITIVFRGNKTASPGQTFGEEPRYLRATEIGLQSAEFRTQSTGSVSPKPTSDADVLSMKSGYLSFYDPNGRYGNAAMQWQPVAPRSPLVYAASPDSESRPRGVYREGGTYYSAE